MPPWELVQLAEQFVGFSDFFVVAFVHNFLQQRPCTICITHLNVSTRQVKLGRCVFIKVQFTQIIIQVKVVPEIQSVIITEIEEIITHLGLYVGLPRAIAAMTVAREVLADD